MLDQIPAPISTGDHTTITVCMRLLLQPHHLLLPPPLTLLRFQSLHNKSLLKGKQMKENIQSTTGFGHAVKLHNV
jgi:hypothetical protein